MKNKIFNSIKSKTMFVFLSSVVVFYIIVQVIFFFASNILADSIGSYNASLAGDFIEKIDTNIYKYRHELLNITFNQSIIDELEKSNSSNNYSIDENISIYLKRLFRDVPIKESGEIAFEEVLITNKDGYIIGSSNLVSGENLKGQIWLNNALENDTYFSDIKYDERTKMYGIDVAVVIEDNNEAIGVIKGFLNITHLIDLKIIDNHRFIYNVYVLTNKNEIIYSSVLYQFLDRFDNGSMFVNHNDGSKGSFISKKDGLLYSYSVSNGFKNYKGSSWILIIEEPLEKALRPLRDLLFVVNIIQIIIFIVFIFTAFYIIFSILKPLENFRVGAEEIAKGNFYYRFRSENNKELISLSNSFNTMVKKLGDSYKKLKQKEFFAIKQTEKLIQVNKELEEFSYIASHDLKEPLRKIAAYGSLLLEEYSDKLDEEGQRYIEIMSRGTLRMDNLLTNLLAYSRVDTRGKEFRLIELNSMISDIISDLEIIINESNAHIIVEKLPRIMGDEIQITQVFQNLIANSIKFRKVDERLVINISCIQDNFKKSIIEVRDNGIGFDLKYKEEVFKPFKKLHSVSEYSGTGIGLAICKKIVKRHHGYINVVSTEGLGTSFTIAFNKERDYE